METGNLREITLQRAVTTVATESQLIKMRDMAI